FLLTADPKYLGNFESIISSLVPRLNSLQTLVSDNPDQIQRLAAAEPNVIKLADTLKKTINFSQAGQSQRAVEVVRSNEVLNLTAAIRQSLDEFVDAEQMLLSDRQEWSRTLQNLLVALIAISLLLAGALSIFLETSARHFVQSLRARTSDLEA